MSTPTNFEKINDLPVLEGRRFYLPSLFKQHCSGFFPPFESELIFGNGNPVYVEFCSGNGDWIAERAANYPDQNWLAVERRMDRQIKILNKIGKKELANLFLIGAEASCFSQYYLKPDSVEGVFINFPDPWPKRRHHKNRLVNKEFIEVLAQILKKEKMVTFVTDDDDYLRASLSYFKVHQAFSPVFSFPFYQTEMQGYGASWFDSLWREKGKTIFYAQFEKK